jgi:N-acetyltransferase
MSMDRQPVLSGALVEMRPLTEADFDALYAAASNPLVWEQHPCKDRTEEPVFREWFDKALSSGGALAVIDRSDGRIIGSSRFDHYDEGRGEVEIGWTFLARSHWGGAYNGEMKRLMIEHASQFVQHVMFTVHEQNWRSRRAVEKLGAVLTGTAPAPYGGGENVLFRLALTPVR